MTPATVVAIISIIVALLVSSGALGWLLRSNTRLVILERITSEHDDLMRHFNQQSIQNNARLALLENNTAKFEVQLARLNKIDSIDAKLDLYLDQLKAVVPRSEHEARWRAIEQRFDGLNDSLDDLHQAVATLHVRGDQAS